MITIREGEYYDTNQKLIESSLKSLLLTHVDVLIEGGYYRVIAVCNGKSIQQSYCCDTRGSDIVNSFVRYIEGQSFLSVSTNKKNINTKLLLL